VIHDSKILEFILRDHNKIAARIFDVKFRLERYRRSKTGKQLLTMKVSALFLAAFVALYGVDGYAPTGSKSQVFWKKHIPLV
jgi:hypothetical protein